MMKKRTLILFGLIMGVMVCHAQKETVSVQVPNQLTLEWMLKHPMGYLPSYNVPKSTVVTMGQTPDSKGQMIWNDFKVDGSGSVSADLKKGLAVPSIGTLEDAHVNCSFNKMGAYIKHWSYLLFFKDKSTAKRYKSQVVRELKQNGYWKEDGMYVNTKEGMPGHVDISQTDEAVSLEFHWAMLIE